MKNKLSKYFKILIMVITFVPLLFSVTAAETELIIGVNSDFQFLDFAKAIAYPDVHINKNVYGSLVTLDENMKAQPDLAKEWDISEDGLKYTFHLRKGAKFHNGKKVIADDIKYSFDRLTNSETGFPYSKFFDSIKQIEIIDDYTVNLHLSDRNSYLMTAIARYFAVFDKENVEKVNEHPVGTGPFEFVERKPGRSVILKAFNDYWDEDLPKIDKVIFNVYRDTETQILALKSGEIDIADQLPYRVINEFEEEKDFQLFTTKNPTTPVVIFFDAMNPPTDNKEVRQALLYSINKEEVVDMATYDFGVKGYDVPLPPEHWALHPNIKDLSYSYNPEKAKKLLKEAGYNKPSDLKITIWTSAFWEEFRDLALIYQENLKKIGIQAEVKQFDWSTYIDKLYNNQEHFNIAITAHGRDYHPHVLFETFIRASKPEEARNNEYNMYIPEAWDLFHKAGKTIEKEKQQELYYELQEIMLDEAVKAAVYFKPTIQVLNEDVKGFWTYSTGYFTSKTIHLKP